MFPPQSEDVSLILDQTLLLPGAKHLIHILALQVVKVLQKTGLTAK